MLTYPDTWKRPWHSVGDELLRIYGGKVYKLSLETGCTCPVRDGTKGTGGCIFCGETGAGEFAERADVPVKEQIWLAKERVAAKVGRTPAGYIAYFQSFTNTYGDFGRLSAMFREAADSPDILILSIATRPDCISEEMYRFLGELCRKKPVWVELGLQTAHERTADFIRRGYDTEVFKEAAKRLKAEGITVIAHMIAGLPGEDEDMIKETARYISGLEGKEGEPLVDGIKIHLLYVLEGTDLGNIYKEALEKNRCSGDESFDAKTSVCECGEDLGISFEGEKLNWHIFSMEEYIELLIDILELLPQRMVIHRITGDAPKSLLLAPMWSANKKRVLNTFSRRLGERESYQGKAL